MYSSFFNGSYGLKFRNGESTGVPGGLGGVAGVAALDLVFIGAFAESLDFLAGDFFRLAVFAVWALVAAGRFLFEAVAGVVVFFPGFCAALTLAADFDFALATADLAFAAAFVAAALALAVALAVLPAAGLALVLAVALLLGLPAAARRAGAARLLADFLAPAFFAGAFFAVALPAALRVGGCFLRALLEALAAALVAAPVRAFLDVFAPDFAAMIVSLVPDLRVAPDKPLTPGNRRARKLPEPSDVDHIMARRFYPGGSPSQGEHLPYAARLENIAPFRVVELLERAKALEANGHRVVHLEVGEPDFATAAPIVEAGHRALTAGATKYTQAQGIPDLRRRIADYYRERAGVAVAPERVVVTAGASGGLLLLSALLLDPGDELLVTDPGYPCNAVFVRLVNGNPVPVPVVPEEGFSLTAARAGAVWGPRTRGLLAASPANPTGAVLSAAALRGLATLAAQRGGFMILDEIYQGLTYEDLAGSGPGYVTALVIDDGLYVLNSFSKYFGMTGWRLGWMVVPEPAVEPLARLAQNLFISPPSVAQHAALAAFEPEAMAIHEQRRGAFARRMQQLSAGLEDLGFTIPVRPGGAFYVYADVSHTGLESMEFCHRLLEEYHVATTPGIDFGNHHAERFVRFAFTTGEEDIALGLERLARALAAWRPV